MNSKRKTLLIRAASAVIASLFLNLAFRTYDGWGVLAFNVLTAVAAAVAFGKLFDRYDAKLSARIEAGDQGSWAVRLNGVELGTITDRDYAAMQRTVFRDGRVAVAQLVNIGRVAFVVFDKLVLGVPIVAFWIAIGLLLFVPESYVDLVRELQKLDPSALAVTAKHFLQIGLMFAMVAFGAMATCGYRFGFRNRYSESIGRLLRQHFRTSVVGDLELHRSAHLENASA